MIGRRSPLLRQPGRKKMTDLCRHLVVDLRDQGTCQKCGSTTRRIEWAHVITRNAPSLLYTPWNTLALCGPRAYRWSCHYWFDSYKTDSMKWWEEKFPDRALKLQVWRHDRSRPPIDRRLEKLALEQEIARFDASTS